MCAAYGSAAAHHRVRARHRRSRVSLVPGNLCLCSWYAYLSPPVTAARSRIPKPWILTDAKRLDTYRCQPQLSPMQFIKNA
ncbi:hypothetical protein MPC4_80067 [Methylocella tundrae]|uniref:Uncharacterized protein n=1 Tax=Methylocella tundrae TaxID=227605 RepID=A0A8B6MDC8_METTU|nr:hypothetical protein MPC1_14610002 [Methylocella tundrae]VTZ52396.1 hypothetical protein MPC4_80067 [Methylocella tundrae]